MFLIKLGQNLKNNSNLSPSLKSLNGPLSKLHRKRRRSQCNEMASFRGGKSLILTIPVRGEAVC